VSLASGHSPCYRQDGSDWHWDRETDGDRLPTEAEWEYACRADTEPSWFWGEDPGGADVHAWYGGNSGGQLHAAEQKQPNAFGPYHMAGTGWEWCWDVYASCTDVQQRA
jgi:formylglycine-generating enzyme required for sulfatase activity